MPGAKPPHIRARFRRVPCFRATAILRGLSHNLDFTRGGAVAERLYTTYQSLIMACLRSFGRPNAKASFARIINGIAELRDAWKFVAASTATPAGTL